MVSIQVVLESGHIHQQFVIFTSLGSIVIIILPPYVEINECPISASVSSMPYTRRGRKNNYDFPENYGTG